VIINADILRKETVALIRQIDAQIEEIKAAAALQGCKPEELRDGVGNWVMSPLLLAKAQAYSTLVNLQTK
jgi:hypothetical protein